MREADIGGGCECLRDEVFLCLEIEELEIEKPAFERAFRGLQDLSVLFQS
jgi:hypothetical protein